ncbi:MAG: alanine--glyoxylate aminotransferase family protein [Gemmatimonadetes bacterium]|nr:alanine--glyoxylate aminotransferase family protein [Gemmatimonadota bacterium]
MRKRRPEPVLLMTPGPTRVPDRVLRAGAVPMIHHRTPEFSQALIDVLDGMRLLFGTDGDVLPVHSTGRGAMEAAIGNLFSPGDELLACCNGKFGAMWASIAESYGVVVHRISIEWSQSVDPADIHAAFEHHPEISAVAVTHCDTATGVLNNVAMVCEIARKHDALAMIDGVSAVGGVPFAFDAWDADVAVTATQKCLMCSPGLSFVALSNRAWKATERATLPRSYWNFQAIRETLNAADAETPGTAPVHLVLQAQEALATVLAEGLDDVFMRHESMARAVADWAAARGLAQQCPDLRRFSPTLTVLAVPPEIDPRAIKKAMRERGILIAAGLGPYRDSAFRLGHMGDIRLADVRRTLEALDAVLTDLRAKTPVPVGGG